MAAAFRAAFAGADDVAPLGDFAAPEPVPVRARPVASVVGGIARAFDVPTVRKPTPVTTYTGHGVAVYVYALESAARRQQFELNDELAAERTIGREPGFTVVRQGNVVVAYRIQTSRVPYYLRGLPFSPHRFYADIERRVAAALDRLR